MSTSEGLLKRRGVNDMRWGMKNIRRRSRWDPLTFLGFVLPGWWLRIHFPYSLDSISIERKVIWWPFYLFTLDLHFQLFMAWIPMYTIPTYSIQTKMVIILTFLFTDRLGWNNQCESGFIIYTMHPFIVGNTVWAAWTLD